MVAVGDPPPVLVPQHLLQAALADAAHAHGPFPGLGRQRAQDLGRLRSRRFDGGWRHHSLG